MKYYWFSPVPGLAFKAIKAKSMLGFVTIVYSDLNLRIKTTTLFKPSDDILFEFKDYGRKKYPTLGIF